MSGSTTIESGASGNVSSAVIAGYGGVGGTIGAALDLIFDIQIGLSVKYEKWNKKMTLKVFLTNGTKSGQKRLLFLSCFLFVCFLSFLLFEYSNSVLLLLVIEFSISIFVNGFFSNLYDVMVTNDLLTFENLWKKKQYPLGELSDVRSFNFYFPYPFNPFIAFVFNNNDKMITKIQNVAKIYLSKGGMDLYISNLKNEFINSR